MNNQNITWITGASSGIGRSLVNKFNSESVLVAGTSRNSADLERFASTLKQKSLFKPAAADVSDSEQLRKNIKPILDEFNVNCLINNAGITTFSYAEDDDPKTIKSIIETNLLGAIYTINLVLPQMIDQKSGMIINILSVAAEKIFTKSSSYSASKAGLLAYANVLREEVRKYNIKIINILPGAARTPIWPNDALEQFAERMMSPDDIARIIFDIYSDKSTVVPEKLVLRPLKGDLD